MSEPKRRARHPISWTLVTILLVAPMVFTLWVPFYARTAPKAGGFPFFYWYQLVWVLAVAGTSILAYLLVARIRRRNPPPTAGQRTRPGGRSSGTEPTS